MNVLVTGGAGYIGSHVTKALAQQGHNPVVFDDLSKGFADAVRYGTLVQGVIQDEETLRGVFREHHIEAVVHMAGSIEVGESVEQPLAYYANNTAGVISLLNAMAAEGVVRLVFSSTAAVYGNPQTDTLKEDHPLQPVNPYGWSKRMVEQILADTARTGTLTYVALRYFNAAGADPAGELGERHNPETHLIPRACLAILGEVEALTVYGDDWPTEDGTPIRDYVHVSDLAVAHVQALEYLAAGGASEVMNLGTGTGYSVGSVLKAVEAAAGTPVPVTLGPRRAGDPVRLVADPSKARQLLQWQPQHSELAEICQTAWNWHASRQQR